VLNIGAGVRHTLNQTLAVLGEILGYQPEPRYEAPRPGDVRHSLADISEARRILGYEPLVGFEEGLRRTIEWYRENLADPDTRGGAA